MAGTDRHDEVSGGEGGVTEQSAQTPPTPDVYRLLREHPEVAKEIEESYEAGRKDVDLYDLLKQHFEMSAHSGAQPGVAARMLWPKITKMIEESYAAGYEASSAASYKRFVLGEGM